MKKLLWFLAVLAAASLAFLGCPTESEDDDPPPPVDLGDIDLRLTGDIYELTESRDPTYGYPVYISTKTAKGGTVSAMVDGRTISESITGGAFDITIPKPAGSSLSSTIPNELSAPWGTIRVSDTTAKSMIITGLGTAGAIGTRGVWKGIYQTGEPNLTTMSITMTTETVRYLYVDKEVTISASQRDWIDGSISDSWSAKAFELKLARGWNVLCIKMTGVMSQANPTNITVELSKNNPEHLLWTYQN